MSRVWFALAGFMAALTLVSSATGLTVIYVDDDAPLGGDGASWATAYRYLQDALAVAGAGDLILIADGIYRPDQAEHVDVTEGDRTATFGANVNAQLIGGFRGVGHIGAPDDRDLSMFETILTGDLAQDDDAGFVNRTDNAFHVLSASDADPILEGLTVSGGYAVGTGGGMLFERTNAIVRRCVITDNLATQSGGGAYFDHGSPTVEDSIITGNSAPGGGGMTFERTVEARVDRCIFAGNSASWAGSAMLHESEQASLVANTLIAAHPGDAHAIYCYSSEAPSRFENCTFVANESDYAVASGYTDSEAELHNCIIWGGLDALLNCSATYSCIERGWPGEGNTSDPPQFRDPDGLDDDVTTWWDNDYRLAPNSPCIDAGQVSATTGELDLDEHARQLCDGVDMGAYEFGMGDAQCDRHVDLRDVQVFQTCFSGTAFVAPLEPCRMFDYVADGRIDLLDYVLFRGEF